MTPFFFIDTATSEIYTLSLHDALPIYRAIDEEASHPLTLGRQLLERHRRDRNALSHFLHPFGHDLLARRQPVLDHPQPADARSDLDRSDRHLVALAHDCDLVAPLQLGDRALGHHQLV